VAHEPKTLSAQSTLPAKAQSVERELAEEVWANIFDRLSSLLPHRREDNRLRKKKTEVRVYPYFICIILNMKDIKVLRNDDSYSNKHNVQKR
jgi:hypothetical protein